MKRPASGGLARVAVHGRSLQNLAYTSQKLTSALGNARPTAAHLALQAAYNLNSVSDAITALENYRSTGDAAAVTQARIHAGKVGASVQFNDSIQGLGGGVAGRALYPGGVGGEKRRKMVRPTTAQQRKGQALAVQGLG